jgi:hypothetical protein
MVVSDTHKLIDSKDPAENPFPLKIHEIILRLMICSPRWSASERFECGEPVSKFHALRLEQSDGVRGIGASRGRRDFVEERGEDGLRVKWDP